MTRKNVLFGLILVLSFALIACGDDGEQQPGPDGGADAVAGDGYTPQPDVYVPPGCEAECLHEAFYLCSKNTTGKCVECTKDADCTNNPNAFGSKCSGTNKCVCDTDADCKDNLNGGKCDKSGTTPKCTCATDADCALSDIPWGNKCGTSRCECKADADCAGNGNGSKCDTSLSKCTCASDSECTKAPYTKCNPAYASASYKVCQKPCNTIGNKCLYYLASAGWPTIDGTLKCNATTGQCAQCNSNADCSGTSPVCDMATGKCVGCKTSADCADSPDGTFCDTSGTTGKCRCKDDTHCKGGYPWGNKCRITGTTATTGICRCESDANCGGNPNGPKCYTTYNKCTCKTDAECKAPFTSCAVPYKGASYSHCRKPCAADGDCPTGLKCNLGNGKCYECKTNADCTGSNKILHRLHRDLRRLQGRHRLHQHDLQVLPGRREQVRGVQGRRGLHGDLQVLQAHHRVLRGLQDRRGLHRVLQVLQDRERLVHDLPDQRPLRSQPRRDLLRHLVELQQLVQVQGRHALQGRLPVGQQVPQDQHHRHHGLLPLRHQRQLHRQPQRPHLLHDLQQVLLHRRHAVQEGPLHQVRPALQRRQLQALLQALQDRRGLRQQHDRQVLHGRSGDLRGL